MIYLLASTCLAYCPSRLKECWAFSVAGPTARNSLLTEFRVCLYKFSILF